MIKRSSTHITDTLAVRRIIAALPENWLVRGLEERDYGIDLSIELFDGENPTGCFALIQAKGTKAAFGSPGTLSGFPTKTLQYAQLFPEPFFIFYTSIDDNRTKFVWIQKYIKTKLNVDNENWVNQAKCTIHFPCENVLGTIEGNRKIESSMRLLGARQSGLDFLADFEILKMHWENFKLGNQALLEVCIDIIARISTHTRFFDVYLHDYMNLDFEGLITDLRALPVPLPVSEDGYPEQVAIALAKVDGFFIRMDAMKMTFLGQRDCDAFEEEYSSSSPY